jgi:hypothetical protein
MAYVDLIAIRAGIAQTLDASEYTRIVRRLRECSDGAASPQRGNHGSTVFHILASSTVAA